MKNLIKSCGLLAAMLLSSGACAGDISVEDAWVRATVPGQDAAMADMRITSKQSASLVGASSSVAKIVEIHSMSHENGMMKMREVKSVELPAGRRVGLGESGYHLMLIGLKAPLKAGDSVPLTLRIRVGKSEPVELEVQAGVRPLTETRAPPQETGHMHHHQH
ncbi:MAG: copper chaperone PCu(A)C [Nitrosomonadales bacterium]|nr:copper chaperone PCu(A)C [Nitrosomonadales bacterium]